MNQAERREILYILGFAEVHLATAIAHLERSFPALDSPTPPETLAKLKPCLAELKSYERRFKDLKRSANGRRSANRTTRPDAGRAANHGPDMANRDHI